MRRGKGGKKKIEKDMKMLHEELNLKLKNLRNLRNLKYVKKLKVKTYEIMKLKNFKKLKKGVKCWRIFLPMRCFQMCILGSLLAICCHWKKVKCKQFKKNQTLHKREHKIISCEKL
jgi:hypothetical protein